MRVIDNLTAEHQVLLRQMEHLHESLNDPSLSLEARRAAVKLFAAGLEGHAVLEEEVLYPALEPHIGRDYGPLAVMDAEHHEVRATLGQIAETADSSQLRALVGHLLETLYAHFSKEENILFALAENFLGQRELEELGERCAASQRPPLL